MHNKPLIAVLALGLLLIAGTAAFAAPDLPGEPPVKAFGSGVSKGAAANPVLMESTPTIEIQSGTERTVPGMFCDGLWQGPLTYRIPGWMTGGEFYAVYQDPDEGLPYSFGSCGVPPNAPFDVTNLNWIVTARPVSGGGGPYPYTIPMQPLTYTVDPLSGACPEPTDINLPGAVSCAGPLYSVTFNNAQPSGGILYAVGLAFDPVCCQSGPYFVGVYLPVVVPNMGNTVQLITDDGTFNGGPVPGQLCRTYNEYGAGWVDLNACPSPPEPACFEVNIMMWSQGYTPDDPQGHCSGACATEFCYDDAAIPDFNFGLPSGSGGGRTRLGYWLDAVGLDTLKAVTFQLSTLPADPPDILLEIFDGDDGGVGCGGKKPSYPGNVLYSEVIPEGSWGLAPTYWPLATPFIWGTLHGGLTQRIVVALSVVPGTGGSTGLLANNDDGVCDASSHFIARYEPVINDWRYIFEVSAIDPCPFMKFDVCRQKLIIVETPCDPGDVAPDDWSEWAHDAQRTGHTSMEVGDPYQVTLQWTTGPLPQTSDFANPTVANDKVYVSTSGAVRAFNLGDGTPYGFPFQGIPEMGGQNRGNVTVANIAALGGMPVVFATGGTGNSIVAMEDDLEDPGGAYPSFIWTRTGLGQQVRFGTAVVVNIGGTDVVFVSTDPGSGTGRLFAIEAATGNLYAPWVAANPVILDAAAKHTPTYLNGKLYVATAVGGQNNTGSLYQIDPADGDIEWNFITGPTEGFPGGVSGEGTSLYGHTRDAQTTPVGRRYKIDVGGALPSVLWSGTQGTGQYGAPVIGSSFVFYALSNPGVGILKVSKDFGSVATNFASLTLGGVSVGQISTTMTLTCDGYLFAGDFDSRWWLFDAINEQALWFKGPFGPAVAAMVNGSSMATESDGDEWVVINVRNVTGTGNAQVYGYRLNAGPRPILVLGSELLNVTVPVPLNSGLGQFASFPGSVENKGAATLNITGFTVGDPPPGADAIRNGRQLRAAANNVARTIDYSDGYFGSNLTKSQRLTMGLTGRAYEGEVSPLDARLEQELAAIASRRSTSRGLAAGAASIRTLNVTLDGAPLPGSVLPGGVADLGWEFDGTGLGRGTDANDLELQNNDPDYSADYLTNGYSTAVIPILYIGGCLNDEDTLHFGAGNSEHVFNYGALGDIGQTDAWIFTSDPINDETSLFDSGLMLLGDSLPDPNGGAQIRVQFFRTAGNGHNGHFVPNARPSDGQCGFDKQTDVLLGAYRDGGCPGTPVDIFGEIIMHSMSDTDQTVDPGTRLSAIGVDVHQTEVGAYDPLYGDFKLIEWEVLNRDAVAKGPLYMGSLTDWDVVADATRNVGNFSAAANGYYIWDGNTSGNAYGTFDPSHQSTYSGIQPMAPAYRLAIFDWQTRQPNWIQDLELTWHEALKETPAYNLDEPFGTQSDKAGLNITAPFNLAANGVAHRYHAYYGVDATSNNDATIAANVMAVAKRAARWGGFARGDVNDDGFVDLADVAWLSSGNPVYPADYSGDVNNSGGAPDAADIAQLLSFVSGNAGAAPVGAWRF